MFRRYVWIGVLAAWVAACGTQSRAAANPMNTSTAGKQENLRLVQSIELPNVKGRIDHLSVDLKGKRLFVAALGNDSVESIDLQAGKWMRSIAGFSEPQGILYLPSLDRLYVANGGTGIIDILDGTSFAKVGSAQLPGDADNLRYDAADGTIAAGYGEGGLSFLDAHSGKIVKDIELGAHPESFQLETSGSKIFVNVPTLNQVAVVDGKGGKVAANWLMTGGAANFPMAFDESSKRLFIGFRVPSKLGVLDSENGALIVSLDTIGDVDDIFYDAAHKLVFVIGGGGAIDLFWQRDADHYQSVQQVATAPGARTGLWVAEWNQLYVAVPQDGSRQAEIRIYELQP